MRPLLSIPLIALAACAQEGEAPVPSPDAALPTMVAAVEVEAELAEPQNPLPVIALPEHVLADFREHEAEGDHSQSIARGGDVEIVYGEALAESLPWRTVSIRADEPHRLKIHFIVSALVEETESMTELSSLDEVPVPADALPEGAEFESGQIVERHSEHTQTDFSTGLAVTHEAGQSTARLALGRNGEWFLVFADRESMNVREPLLDPAAVDVFWLPTEGIHLDPGTPTPIAVFVPTDEGPAEPPLPGTRNVDALVERYDRVAILALSAQTD